MNLEDTLKMLHMVDGDQIDVLLQKLSGRNTGEGFEETSRMLQKR